MTGDLLSGDLVGRVDAILVWQTSRFMRDAMAARVWKHKLDAHGVRVVATQQDFADDATGTLAESIFEALDQYESEVNGARTRLALREAARQGFFPTSRAPFGFHTEKVEVTPGVKRTKLVLDATEAATVREVFESYVAGRGAMQVARDMNERGLRDRGGRPWRKDRVLHVVSDRVAVGRYVWCRQDEDPIEIPCEAIIGQDIFDAAQRLRNEREPAKNPGRTSSSPLLLARVAHCGCGAKLILETSGKEVGGATPFRYYNCREHKRGRGKEACLGVRVSESALDEAVLTNIADRAFSAERCREMLIELLETTDALQERTAAQRQQIRRELDETERKVRTWESHVENGDVPIAVASERLQALRAQRDDLRSAIAKVVPLRALRAESVSDATVEQYVTTLRTTLMSRGPVARTYLRFLVERIEVRRERGDMRRVKIIARKGNAMRLLYAVAQETDGTTTPGDISRCKPPGVVRTCDLDQLRELDSNQ